MESRTAICEVLFEEGRLNFISSQPTNKITSQSSSYRIAKNATKFHWCNWNFHWRSIFECACSTGWIDNGWINNYGFICYYGYFWYGFDYGQLRIVCDYNKYNQFKWRYLYYLRLNEVTWGQISYLITLAFLFQRIIVWQVCEFFCWRITKLIFVLSYQLNFTFDRWWNILICIWRHNAYEMILNISI